MFDTDKTKMLVADVVKNSSHPFLIILKDGHIILANNAFCQLTGFTEKELLKMTVTSDLTPQEWHDLEANAINEVNRTKMRLTFNKEFLGKSGTKIPVSVSIYPCIDNNGQVLYYYYYITDLTTIKQALQELEKRETYLQQLTENMLDMYKQVDSHGFIQYASPSHKPILGYEPKNLVGTLVFNLVHPEDRDRIIMEFYTHLDKRKSARVEYRCCHADGHYLYLETIGNWLIEEDKVIGIIMVSRDITEKKLTETALRQSEEKFSKIFLYNPDTITISTLNGQFVDVNEAFVQLSGYERNEVIGRNVLDLGLWVNYHERERLITILHNKGNIRGVEAKFKTKSGNIIIALLSMEIFHMQGEPHLLVIVKDITDRQRLYEGLRLSEERFSKAFNASPLLMSISSLEDGRLIDVNHSFCRSLGYEREELLGNTSIELDLWQNPTDRILIRQLVIDEGSITNYECNFITKSGQLLLGLCSAEKIEIGEESCILLIVMNITERKQMEMEMTRLDRMNTVGQVAASIGHEIRNPMTTVRGFLQVLSNKEQYAEDREIFNLMIDEMDRANSIIKEFLYLSNDKLIQPTTNNINSIISSMFPLFQADAMAQDKNIYVRLEKVPDLLLDEKEIRQLMLNLVRNGLEAMSAGGTLTIRSYVESSYVVLSIQDQGHGMSKEVLEKLGTPFFTTKEDGTGLGIAVCYGIARRHGAVIDIDTSPIGTRFDIKFQFK